MPHFLVVCLYQICLFFLQENDFTPQLVDKLSIAMLIVVNTRGRRCWRRRFPRSRAGRHSNSHTSLCLGAYIDQMKPVRMLQSSKLRICTTFRTPKQLPILKQLTIETNAYPHHFIKTTQRSNKTHKETICKNS